MARRLLSLHPLAGWGRGERGRGVALSSERAGAEGEGEVKNSSEGRRKGRDAESVALTALSPHVLLLGLPETIESVEEEEGRGKWAFSA